MKKHYTSKALDGLRTKLIEGMMKRRLKRLDEIANLSIDEKHYKIDEEIEQIVRYFMPRRKYNMNDPSEVLQKLKVK